MPVRQISDLVVLEVGFTVHNLTPGRGEGKADKGLSTCFPMLSQLLLSRWYMNMEYVI